MITCRMCNKTGSDQLFSTRNGQKTNWCLLCKSRYDKVYYNKTVEVRRTKQISRAKKNQLKNRLRLLDFFKNHSCVQCGEADPIVLELDHIVNKRKNISDMIRNHSWRSIRYEIKKCQVLCANCHRRKTAKQFDYHRYTRPTKSTNS